MKTKLFAGVAALLLVAGTQAPANAAVFDFSYSGLQFGTTTAQTVTGTLTTNSATPISSGSQTITGITGTDNGAAITGLLAAGSYLGNDNLLFYPAGSGSFIDHSGFSFSTAGLNANIFTDFSSAYLYEDTSGTTSIGGSFTLAPASTAVPEPGSLGLLLAGALGCLVAVRSRKRMI